MTLCSDEAIPRIFSGVDTLVSKRLAVPLSEEAYKVIRNVPAMVFISNFRN